MIKNYCVISIHPSTDTAYLTQQQWWLRSAMKNYYKNMLYIGLYSLLLPSLHSISGHVFVISAGPRDDSVASWSRALSKVAVVALDDRTWHRRERNRRRCDHSDGHRGRHRGRRRRRCHRVAGGTAGDGGWGPRQQLPHRKCALLGHARLIDHAAQ